MKFKLWYIIILAVVISVNSWAQNSTLPTPIVESLPATIDEELSTPTVETPSQPVASSSFPEPSVVTIKNPKDYYKKAYGYNTRDTCSGKMCLQADSEVGCSYSYHDGGIAGTRVQVCSMQYIKKADGTSEYEKNLMMVTGIIDANGGFSATLPEKEVLLVKRSWGKWKQITFVPSPQLTLGTAQDPAGMNAGVCAPGTDCSQPDPCASPNSSKIDTLICTSKGFETIATPTAASEQPEAVKDFSELVSGPLPRSLNLTCNANQSEENCHLCNCYHESRGEPLNGKIAVIRTVLARIKNRHLGAHSSCTVVYAPAQFSWTTDKNTNDITTSDSGEIRSVVDCKNALEVAKRRGAGTPYFFNPKKARPRWARVMKVCATIKNHRFVVPQKMSCPPELGFLTLPSKNIARFETGKDEA